MPRARNAAIQAKRLATIARNRAALGIGVGAVNPPIPPPPAPLTLEQIEAAMERSNLAAIRQYAAEQEANRGQNQPPTKRPRVEKDVRGQQPEVQIVENSQGKTEFEVQYERMETKRSVFLDLHVDQSDKLDVIEGKYIDLEKMLLPLNGPKSDNDKKNIALCDIGDEEFRFKAVAPKRKLDSPITWNEAFRVLMFVELEVFPQRMQPMLQYMHNINTFFHVFTWDSVKLYDMNFRRALAAGLMVSWASANESLRGVMIHKPPREFRKPGESNGPFKPFAKSTHGQTSTATTGRPQKSGTFKSCKSFNLNVCNRGTSCPYAHICYNCGQKHRSCDCPDKKPATTPSR